MNLAFKDLGADVPPTVQITAPQTGPVIVGTINVQGTAALGTPVSDISTFQLLVDGKAVGTAVQNQTYPGSFAIPFDTTILSSGSHTLAVVATDTFGLTGVSSPVTIQVNNFVGTPLVTSVSPTFTRNNFTGYVGMYFTVGPTALQVSAFGRYCIGTGTHGIKLGLASTGADVPGSSTTVNLQGCLRGSYAYVQLVSPVVLAAGTDYELVDQETAGGDSWYDYSPITTTGAVTVKGPYYVTNGGASLVNAPSYSYVPLNLIYCTATTSPSGLNVAITGLSNNTITLAETSNAAITGIQVLEDGYTFAAPITNTPYTQSVLSLNYGTHVYTAVAHDAAGNTATSAPDTFTTSPVVAYGNVIDDVNVTPGPARNNYTGWVGFQFTTGSSFFNQSFPADLGRACLNGNTQPHIVKLVLASTGADVPGASTVINCPTAFASSYTYGPIDYSEMLPNTTYYLVSQETAGGDQFSDIGPASPVADARLFTIDVPVYFDGHHYVLVPMLNYSDAGVYLSTIVYHE